MYAMLVSKNDAVNVVRQRKCGRPEGFQRCLGREVTQKTNEAKQRAFSPDFIL